MFFFFIFITVCNQRVLKLLYAIDRRTAIVVIVFIVLYSEGVELNETKNMKCPRLLCFQSTDDDENTKSNQYNGIKIERNTMMQNAAKQKRELS